MRFFAARESGMRWNPTFHYSGHPGQAMSVFPQHTKYMALATNVLKSIIRKFGSEEAYRETVGGPVMQVCTTVCPQLFALN